jgi:hypothetical protein
MSESPDQKAEFAKTIFDRQQEIRKLQVENIFPEAMATP